MSQPEKVIILTVDADGLFTIEPQAYQGEGCRTDTQPLENLLGVVTETSLKTEYFVAEVKQAAQQFEP